MRRKDRRTRELRRSLECTLTANIVPVEQEKKRTASASQIEVLITNERKYSSLNGQIISKTENVTENVNKLDETDLHCDKFNNTRVQIRDYRTTDLRFILTNARSLAPKTQSLTSSLSWSFILEWSRNLGCAIPLNWYGTWKTWNLERHPNYN